MNELRVYKFPKGCGPYPTPPKQHIARSYIQLDSIYIKFEQTKQTISFLGTHVIKTQVSQDRHEFQNSDESWDERREKCWEGGELALSG